MSTTIMIQGTASDAGKSILVAALCRALVNQGKKVAPFKPQNMALNSSVTKDGKEIGRAQAVQAMACKIDATEHMNPVLLKPNSDIGAQVIVHGKAINNMDAVDYHDYKTTAMNAVLESHRVLQNEYDIIVVEGAGSPAEINLRDKDIANMGFAEAVDCPVVLVADIDKGGVFAQIIGTLELISESERQRIVGFIINKFRGDIALLKDGIDWLENKTGKPVLGVMPYLHDLYIEAEDSINTQQPVSSKSLDVVVPVLSRISNHTDFDALRLHPEVNLQFVPVDKPPPACDLIILPGSKNVIADLKLLIKNNWYKIIQRHLRYGGKLLGICGGMQMLGKKVFDPERIESDTPEADGFGLAEFETRLLAEKTLQQKTGKLVFDNADVNGYEIHAGVSNGPAFNSPLIRFDNNTSDGFINNDNNIIGSYLHGLFDSQEACSALVNWAGLDTSTAFDFSGFRNEQLDKLADTFSEHVDIDMILRIIS